MKRSIYLFLTLLIIAESCRNNSKIDRYQLVTSNNVENSFIDSLNSLAIGNGEFYFSVDITGLQTFPEFYSGGAPLETMSDWIWNRRENSGNHSHLNLGMIGLQILKKNGDEISINDISDPVQNLNLWTGEIDSRFNIEGLPVHIKTVCHPYYDMISTKIISGLLRKNRLKIRISFNAGGSSSNLLDFESAEINTTKIVADTNNYSIISKQEDKNNYYVLIWRNSAELKEVTQQIYYLEPHNVDSVYSFSCQFMSNQESGRMQNFGETETASKRSWEKFWSDSSMVDLQKHNSHSTKEMERQSILSRYLTKIQCCGTVVHGKKE
ncbi:MAG: hypothetical protein WA816_10750 [Bacteroidales bacterium]